MSWTLLPDAARHQLDHALLLLHVEERTVAVGAAHEESVDVPVEELHELKQVASSRLPSRRNGVTIGGTTPQTLLMLTSAFRFA